MTKKQRNEIYKKALEILPTKGIHKPTNSFSLCWALVYALDSEEYHLPSMLPELKEFDLFNPHNDEDCFWLGYRDLQTRQIILDFCIEMTS